MSTSPRDAGWLDVPEPCRGAEAAPARHQPAVADGQRKTLKDAVDEPEERERFTRWETAPDGSRTGVSSLQLSGLHCAACAGIIEQALCAVDGVTDARVSAGARLATVRWREDRTRASALIDAVRAAGYGAAPDVAVAAREMRRREHRDAVWRLFVATFLSMQVMMLATPSYVAAPGDLSVDMERLLNWGQWVLSLPVIGFSGMPFLRGAWRSVRARRIGMDVPVGLGLAVAFAASTAATFDPGGVFGHEVYFDSLTMFLAFLWLGRLLDIRTRHRAAQALEATMDALPRTALRVAPHGDVETVSVHRLRPGDRVRVEGGGGVPADGSLLSDAAQVAQALLTGESEPVTRRQGDELLAGSLNAGPPFEMRVERVGADTRHEAIVALMRETLSQRPAAARVADRWAGPFLWTVLLLAAASAAYWSVVEPSRAVWVAVSVLIVTCPCALSLATPATLVAAAGGLARRGVLLRRLEALETMVSVKHVAIDKTGTLTEDKLRWTATVLAAKGVNHGGCQALPRTASEALALAASLAQWSRHPASLALVDAAQADMTVPVQAWSAVDEVPGCGVEATDAQGHRWRLGLPGWAVTSQAQPIPEGARPVLACNGGLVAAFQLEEAVRPDAQAVVAALQRNGIAVELLSGDAPERARALAQRLGIEHARGGLDPQGKGRALQAVQARGVKVAMVGDGINDAPVLAAADVSLAMGHAALAARQEADAVLLGGEHGSLSGLIDLHRTAHRTLRVMHQNVGWSAAYNAACVPLAMVGWLPPWAAGLGMAASSLLVILNAQRASHATRPVETRLRA